MYDVIVVGGGPGGLNSALYSSRYGLKTLVLDPMPGGYPLKVPEIPNYLGFEKISGFELAEKWVSHAKSAGVEIKNLKVENVAKLKTCFKVITPDGIFKSKTIIFATGTKRRTLAVKGVKEFEGKGVTFCVTCDGPFYSGKKVLVVGGANSAVGSALYMSKIAKKVYLVYRKNKLRAQDVFVKELLKRKNVEVIYNANVIEAKGSDFLEKVSLDNGKELTVEGMFIEIGGMPVTSLVEGLGVMLTKEGNIKVDCGQKTSVEGVYAVGDVSSGCNAFNQIATAIGEGAIAAHSILSYLQEKA